MSIIQSHTTASLSDNWRTINIDALDPESSQNFDIATLHGALPNVSEAEVRQLAGQVRQLLRGGDTEGALRGACESAPVGASDAVKVCALSVFGQNNPWRMSSKLATQERCPKMVSPLRYHFSEHAIPPTLHIRYFPMLMYVLNHRRYTYKQSLKSYNRSKLPR